MNKSEIEFEVKKALKVLKHKRGVFKKNELAYLALTSKPELQFRDRLAFQLHGAINGDILIFRMSLMTLHRSPVWE